MKQTQTVAAPEGYKTTEQILSELQEVPMPMDNPIGYVYLMYHTDSMQMFIHFSIRTMLKYRPNNPNYNKFPQYAKYGGFGLVGISPIYKDFRSHPEKWVMRPIAWAYTKEELREKAHEIIRQYHAREDTRFYNSIWGFTKKQEDMRGTIYVFRENGTLAFQFMNARMAIGGNVKEEDIITMAKINDDNTKYTLFTADGYAYSKNRNYVVRKPKRYSDALPHYWRYDDCETTKKLRKSFHTFAASAVVCYPGIQRHGS